ncbi:hypothetical protein [Streptomyces sp. NPDC000961]|uniref:hypothetical protein n=1 Tax=Streptomyces sp. NPDC000961 TaxID=3364541 RepID=UPI0036879A94
MPIKALGSVERKANAPTVDYCNTHGHGCKKHRNPNPEWFGHRDSDGRGRMSKRWVMTPDEMLDAELEFRITFISLQTAGKTYAECEEEFLSLPCRVAQMPRDEFARRFRWREIEIDEELAVQLTGLPYKKPHTQHNDVSDFEEME